MDRDELRVGVVGTGWFGRIHLDAWSSVRGARVVGVCDRDPARLDAASRAAQDAFHDDAGGGDPVSLPAEASRHTSLDDLLDLDLDLLDVVVTEDAHPMCVAAGLRAGVDVVVEKPLALDVQTARRLFDLADEQGRAIHVGHVLRFDPRHVVLAEELRGQRIHHLSLSRSFQSAAHDVYGRVHPVFNASIHDVDLAVWFAGGPPDRVRAFTSHVLGRSTPDCIDAVLEWDGGARAVVQNSWLLPASCPHGFSYDATVHASGGTYTVRSEPILHRWTAAGVSTPEMFLWPRYAGARRGALVDELQYATDRCAAGGASDRVTSEEVLAVVATCGALVRACDSGREERPANSLLGRPSC